MAYDASVPAPRISKRGWQADVWDYRKMVPELGYSARFVANAFRRIRFVIALEDDDGQPMAARDGDGIAVSPIVEEAQVVLRQFRSPIGGPSALYAGLAAKQWVTGEAFAAPSERDGLIVGYDALSTSEIVTKGTCRTEDGEFAAFGRLRGPNSQPVMYPCGTVPIRFWTPDDEYGEEPDSCVRPLIELLEVMVLLTRAMRGAALSRLHSGIILVPDELSFPPLPDIPDEDAFQALLVEAFSAPIQDKAAAAAFTPFALTGPADLIDKVRHLDLSKVTDATVLMALRMQATTLFAQGVDLPVETVTGHSNTTYANALQVSADVYQQHLEPLALGIGDGVASAFLRPLLDGRPDAERVLVIPEPSGLVSRPDNSADVLEAYKVAPTAISNATLIDALGLPENPPSPEELDQRISVANAMGSTQPPSMTAAVDVAVQRAVSAAGARLRSRLNGKPEALTLAGVPNDKVPAALGPARVAALSASGSLIAGEFAALAEVIGRTHGPEAARQACAQAEARALALIGG